MKKQLITTAVLALSLVTVPVQAGNSLVKETDVEAIVLKVANDTMKIGYKLISVADLKDMIDIQEDFILIDAHPQNEFDLAHIDGAINFGFQSKRVGKWEDDVAMPGNPSQEDYAAALGADKNKKIVIYCGFTKCGRSHNAAAWAMELGYTNIYRAPGGISAWMDAGYPYKTNIK